jgi:hypothetical protein
LNFKAIGLEFMRDMPTTEEMPHEDSDVVVSAVDLAAAHEINNTPCGIYDLNHEHFHWCGPCALVG